MKNNEFIHWNDFIHLAPKALGDSVRIKEHDGCSGSSPALKIERKQNGDIAAHCFRCGMSGFKAISNHRIPITNNIIPTKKLSLPKDFTLEWMLWSKEAIDWITKYGITRQETSTYGIGYSNSLKRLLIPAYNNGELIGYQARKLLDSDPYPKYYTKRRDKDSILSVLCFNNSTDSITICEDVLSAIKCSSLVNSIALFGNNLHDTHTKEIIKFKKAFIFLDNDNAQVKKQQIKIQRQLEMYLPVKLILHDKDPKECTYSELYRLLI